MPHSYNAVLQSDTRGPQFSISRRLIESQSPTDWKRAALRVRSLPHISDITSAIAQAPAGPEKTADQKSPETSPSSQRYAARRGAATAARWRSDP